MMLVTPKCPWKIESPIANPMPIRTTPEIMLFIPWPGKEHLSCRGMSGRPTEDLTWLRSYDTLAALKNTLIGLTLLSLSAFAQAPSPSKVTFDAAGITLINGKPFFPIGIFNYAPDTAALADIRKQGFNTLVAATEHHKPEHLALISSHGLRVICPPTDAWLEPAKKDPAMLAWYLADEPEGHGQTPAALHEKYLELKKKDPDHPIALDHFLLDSLAPYKDDADVTMTSYYPLLAGGGPALENFAVYQEKSRSIHGQNWPHWPFIQVFGGPNTDGGKWKQPEPDEVRALVYLALVHRAQGIFYFSYWPQAPKTWAAVGNLNREIRTLTPWLVAQGHDLRIEHQPSGTCSRSATYQLNCRSCPRYQSYSAPVADRIVLGRERRR